MASAYGIIHQYSKPTSDFNTELAMNVMGHRQQKYNANEIKIEQTMSRLGMNINTIKNQAAKEYLYNNINSLVNNINNLSKADLSKSSVTKGIIGHISNALDQKSMYHIAKGRDIENFFSNVNEIKKEDGGSGYSDTNLAYALYKSGYSGYINGGLDAKLGNLSYTKYRDVKGKMNDVFMEYMDNLPTVDYIDVNSNVNPLTGDTVRSKQKMSITSLTSMQVRDAVVANLNEKDLEQLKINAWANFGAMTKEKLKDFAGKIYKSRKSNLISKRKAALMGAKNLGGVKGKYMRDKAAKLSARIAALSDTMDRRNMSKESMLRFIGLETLIADSQNTYKSFDRKFSGFEYDIIEAEKTYEGTKNAYKDFNDPSISVNEVRTPTPEDIPSAISNLKSRVDEKRTELKTMVDRKYANLKANNKTITLQDGTTTTYSKLLSEYENNQDINYDKNGVMKKYRLLNQLEEETGDPIFTNVVVGDNYYNLETYASDYKSNLDYYNNTVDKSWNSEWEKNKGEIYDYFTNRTVYVNEKGEVIPVNNLLNETTKEEFKKNGIGEEKVLKRNLYGTGLIESMGTLYGGDTSEFNTALTRYNTVNGTSYTIQDILKFTDAEGNAIDFDTAMQITKENTSTVTGKGSDLARQAGEYLGDIYSGLETVVELGRMTPPLGGSKIHIMLDKNSEEYRFLSKLKNINTKISDSKVVGTVTGLVEDLATQSASGLKDVNELRQNITGGDIKIDNVITSKIEDPIIRREAGEALASQRTMALTVNYDKDSNKHKKIKNLVQDLTGVDPDDKNSFFIYPVNDPYSQNQRVAIYQVMEDPENDDKSARVKLGEFYASDVSNRIGVNLNFDEGDSIITDYGDVTVDDFTMDEEGTKSTFYRIKQAETAERTGKIIPGSSEILTTNTVLEGINIGSQYVDTISDIVENTSRFKIEIDEPLPNSSKVFSTIYFKGANGDYHKVGSQEMSLDANSYRVIRNTARMRPQFFVKTFLKGNLLKAVNNGDKRALKRINTIVRLINNSNNG